jgi:alkanesulfonate monooxygenase SsuD/methylene tetrahydromethanopterin reductase-like flavin-dependent oxidoreductase (luciferase family)
MLVPSRHPLELAEENNTLNELGNNRFILGGGIGYKPDEFENCGWDFKTRARRFEECIEILRLAMTGEHFDYDGQHFAIKDVMIQPAALRGEIPPIWVGAVSEPAMKRAGRLGDGWIASFAEHLIELRDKVATDRSIAAQHGRPATLALMRDVHVAPTRAKIDPQFLSNVVKVWQSYDDLGSKADLDDLANEEMFGGKEVSLEEFAPNRAVVGTPKDCIRELERIRDNVAPEWLFITPIGVPDPVQQVEELRLFAREIMPHFRQKPNMTAPAAHPLMDVQ